MKRLNVSVSFVLLMSLVASVSAVELRPQETVVTTTRIRDINRDTDMYYYGVPMGNGRQGAMINGHPRTEKIILNELTLWSGGPVEADKQDAYKYLPRIREMLLDKTQGKKVAEPYITEHFLCKGDGTGRQVADKSGRKRWQHTQFGAFQNLAHVDITFLNAPSDDEIKNYRRSLDMGKALATVAYEYSGHHHNREHFVSFPDKVFATRIATDDPDGVSFMLKMIRVAQFTTEKYDDNTLIIYGTLPDNDKADDNDGGMSYAAYLRVFNDGGTINIKDGILTVSNARSVIVYQTARTDYAGPDGTRGEDPRVSALRALKPLRAADYENIKKRHVADFHSLFSRVDLRFGPENKKLAETSIEDRMAQHAKDPDKDMSYPAVIFNFGRYLLMSSCREGGLPPNLQGIWAVGLRPPWNGDYHLDINLQMNMWPAEVSNLPECHSTMVDYIEKVLVPNGRKTAKAYFNVSDGWINFIQSNVWGYTSPLKSGAWSIATSATPWLCQHLWWHYDYNRDEEYLKRIYPVLKGALNTFIKGVLVKHPETGKLVTIPSHSPELGGMCYAASIDSQSIRELMRNVIKSSEILSIDKDYREEVRAALAIMPRDTVTSDKYGKPGRLAEWYLNDRAYEGHRHISHMWSLFPGIEVNWEDTPELAAAARQSLVDRRLHTTGWGQAHRLACWGRIGDKDMFHRQFVNFAKPFIDPVESFYAVEDGNGSGKDRMKGRLLPSLFGLHPPFQIDCNFGITAGIAEGLMNSYPGRIILLPALPDSWGTGSVNGLKARGNITVNMEWEKGRLKHCVLESPVAQKLVVQYKGKKQEVALKSGKSKKVKF
ncbi:glycoside hydrolase N-terminal domain-containing protein [Verrucomicrobiota bacterium]